MEDSAEGGIPSDASSIVVEILALRYALAAGGRTAVPTAAEGGKAAPESEIGERSLTEELESHWSRSWLSCGKMWRICGDCDSCTA